MRIFDGLYAFSRLEKSGWPVGMHVLKLKDGRTLVHSPTHINDETYSTIERIGAPRFLLAPNHFHNLGIDPYAARFPGVRVVATPSAAPRLRKKVRAAVEDISEINAHLPEGALVHACEGCKNGEVLLSLQTESGRAWLVCDSFFNVVTPVTGVVGLVLRRLNIVPHLKKGRTFAWVGVRDKRVYKAWLLALLEAEKPSFIVPSHGVPFAVGDRAAVARLITEF